MSEEQAEVVPEVKVDEDALRAALNTYQQARAAVDDAVRAIGELRKVLTTAQAEAVALARAFGKKPIQHKGQVYSVQGGKLKRQELTNLDG